jgi:ABC-2 type transport system ATP-binding protein
MRFSGEVKFWPWLRGCASARTIVVLGAMLLAATVATTPARADTVTVASFDGTQIHVNFFPAATLAPHHKAATVMFGPGWSAAGDTNVNDTTDLGAGTVGVGTLRHAGFNVITWDPRGFGASGGTVEIDSPQYEARDVSAIIDWLAKQPQALLDRPGDPRVGMAGGSYGGGIQPNAAAVDPRIDAIVPDLAWHSLLTSLYKEQDFKLGWNSILYPAGQAAGHLDPIIGQSYATAVLGQPLTPTELDYFATRGPGDTEVRRIRIPTLFIQGTVDDLFTLQEAIDNYTILRQDGVPVKMLWFCGGHAICITNPGDTSIIQRDTLAWLHRYLDRNTHINTGPTFQWVDQDGVEHTGADYPLAAATPITADGSGTLALMTAGGSGPVTQPATVQSNTSPSISTLAAPFAPAKANNAVNVTISAPARLTQVVGAPRLTLTYSGVGAGENVTSTHVLAQIVDDSTGYVLNNQITPIPVILDGQPHTLTQPLEALSATAKPGETFTLQLVANSTAYQTQRATGAVSFSRIHIQLPTVNPSAQPPGYGSIAPNGCTVGGTLRITLPPGTRTATATVGRRVVGRGRRRLTVHLVGLGLKTVRVRIFAHERDGSTRILTRRLRACP